MRTGIRDRMIDYQKKSREWRSHKEAERWAWRVQYPGQKLTWNPRYSKEWVYDHWKGSFKAEKYHVFGRDPMKFDWDLESFECCYTVDRN